MSETTTDILVHTEAGVCTITFNRVDKKNSITQLMYGTMADALASAATDDAVRVVVIQGDATIFSAGNDIGDFLNRQDGQGLPQESPTFRFLHGIASFPSPCWRPSAARPWASAPPCCCTATWSMPATTPRSPCPS
jgi:enoyl-CoA hydratase/carnithine racemase